MLIAINDKGERVEFCNADPTQKYFCPVCGTELILKKGEIKIYHFAHKVGNDICPFAFEGESETLEAMKKGIKELFFCFFLVRFYTNS